jgi:hypothetical protein
VQWDGSEAKCAKEDRDTLSLVDRAGEDDGWMTDVVVEEMNEVQILPLEWEEDVAL